MRYLDGDIDANLMRELEAHFSACHNCKVVYDTCRKTIELYCDGKLFTLPEDVHSRLHSALQKKWAENSGCN